MAKTILNFHFDYLNPSLSQPVGGGWGVIQSLFINKLGFFTHSFSPLVFQNGRLICHCLAHYIWPWGKRDLEDEGGIKGFRKNESIQKTRPSKLCVTLLVGTESVQGLYACIYWKKWKFGRVTPMPDSLTDNRIQCYSACQKYKVQAESRKNDMMSRGRGWITPRNNDVTYEQPLQIST